MPLLIRLPFIAMAVISVGLAFLRKKSYEDAKGNKDAKNE